MGTKEEILKVAIKLFEIYGYHKTTMDMITSEAGVAKGTLYWHFPNKKELFMAIMESGIINYHSFLENIKENQELTSVQKLEKIIEQRGDFFAKHRHWVREVMSNREDIDKDFKKRMKELREKHVALLEGIFEEGVNRGEFKIEDPYIAALIFMGTIFSLTSDKKLISKGSQGRTNRILKDILLQGILNK